MTAVDYGQPRTWRRRLNALWRQRLTEPAAPVQAAAAAPPPGADVEQHIYTSQQTEHGQTTTALGRHTAEQALVAPTDIPGDRTQVIRVPKPPGPDLAHIAEAVARARNELGQLPDMPIAADDGEPPIYLATQAAIERLNALPPTPCASCGLKRWDAQDLQPGDEVCTCDKPFDDEPAKEGEDQ
ncbi:hypothetical protein ACQPZX_41550 [Actinoplanes sp. CA-142083]|uniref:hypothetical protein n=1 Tax=Actinoplanes sp. CA-142083 TaxID=3239903 RepID=UPI003D92AB89